MTDLTNQKSLLRRIKCHFKMCGCLPKHDNSGVWAECVTCGKKTAFIEHEIMESYSNLMDAHKKHNELVERMGRSEYGDNGEGK